MTSKIHESRKRPNGNVAELLSSDVPELTPELIQFQLNKAHRMRSGFIFQMTRRAVVGVFQMIGRMTRAYAELVIRYRLSSTVNKRKCSRRNSNQNATKRGFGVIDAALQRA